MTDALLNEAGWAENRNPHLGEYPLLFSQRASNRGNQRWTSAKNLFEGHDKNAQATIETA